MTARAPHVRIVHGFGLDIASARSARIDVTDDGVLEVRRPGHDPVVVASAADVTQVVWLDAERTTRVFATGWQQVTNRLFGWWLGRRGAGSLAGSAPPWMGSGACVVLTAGGPVASWLVDEVTPGDGDASQRRTTSGSVALARGLGLTLEAATESDTIRPADVRRVWLRRSTTPRWLSPLAELSAIGSLLLAVASWSIAGNALAAVLAPLSLVLGAWVVAANVLLRRRALSLIGTPPVPEGRTVCRPAGLDASDPQQLQIGADDVVVVDGDGGETWLPGPALGGVATIMVLESATTFLDSRHAVLHGRAGWRLAADEAGRGQLERACREVGIEPDVVSAPARSSGALNVHLGPGLGMGDLGPLGPYFLGFTPFALVPGGLVAAQDVPWLGWTVVVGAVAMLAGRAWCWWSLRGWRRSVLRRETS